MLSKDNQNEFLFNNWADIAADAYEGFINNGRGCMVVCVQNVIKLNPDQLGAVISTSFIPAAALAPFGREMPNLKSLIHDYDPLTQVAVVWMDTDGNYELTLVGILDFDRRDFETLQGYYEARRNIGKLPQQFSNPPFQTVRLRPGYDRVIFKN